LTAASHTRIIIATITINIITIIIIITVVQHSAGT
jgi:hypothetical protein